MGAVGLAGLPVPGPELALAVPAQHIAPVRRERRLAGVSGHCVPLHCRSLAKDKRRKPAPHSYNLVRLMACCDADAMTPCRSSHAQDIYLPSRDLGDS